MGKACQFELRQADIMANDVGRPVVTVDDLAPNWRDIMHATYGVVWQLTGVFLNLCG